MAFRHQIHAYNSLYGIQNNYNGQITVICCYLTHIYASQLEIIYLLVIIWWSNFSSCVESVLSSTQKYYRNYFSLLRGNRIDIVIVIERNNKNILVCFILLRTIISILPTFVLCCAVRACFIDANGGNKTSRSLQASSFNSFPMRKQNK